MSAILAVLTSDPNLLGCELPRLEGKVLLADATPNAVARGLHAPEDVLLERYGPQSLPSMAQLVPEGESSPSLLFHSRHLPIGMSLEDNTQPFRFRRWLFAHQGKGLGLGVRDFSALRRERVKELPDYLQRSLRGDTDSELAFLLFLKGLREMGKTEDPRIDANAVASALREGMIALAKHARSAGSVGLVLNAVATNGRVLVATRLGAPLFYTVMEPCESCEPCGLTGSEPDAKPLARAHRRRRTVVVASHLADSRGWVEIEEGKTLAIDATLEFKLL